ncbi:MAG TPA: phosphopantetheine-binding protein [Acidimicrobiales bacterium]|nr:phosphopantetheine-binding protein [Acidimicrobiales bacterium]
MTSSGSDERDTTTTSSAVEVSAPWLRSVWAGATGDDPGPLEPADELAALGLWGVDRVVVVGAVETALGIELPADLVAELRSVGDLLHYAGTLRDHQASPPPPVEVARER